jgi:hypothetical protein
MSAGEREAAALAVAAEALETELRRYEQLAVAVQRERLTSEKALRRAAQKLTELGGSDARLGEHVQALLAAINAARERHDTHAAAVQARADEIRQRSEVLTGLLTRWETLGRDAAELSRLSQGLLAGETEGNGSPVDQRRRLDEVLARLERLAEDAETLQQAARDREFADLTEQAGSLRSQLLAVLNKLRLLQGRLPETE